jgi:hypothetical protein
VANFGILNSNPPERAMYRKASIPVKMQTVHLLFAYALFAKAHKMGEL